MEPKFIEGNRIFDNRGSLEFSNKLDFTEIKRYYIVHNYSKNFIRAWHGHLHEQKFIKCIQGTFQISAVKLDNLKRPNKKNKIYNFFINSNLSDFVHIPSGFANGSMSLEDNSKLLIFSNLSLSESQKDDYRYSYNYWNPWPIQQR